MQTPLVHVERTHMQYQGHSGLEMWQCIDMDERNPACMPARLPSRGP